MNKWELLEYGDEKIDSAFIDKENYRDRIPVMIRSNRVEKTLMYFDREVAPHAAIAVENMTVREAHAYLRDVDPKELLLTSLLKGNTF